MMDKQFLMGHGDGLARAAASVDEPVTISDGWHDRLIVAAMREAFAFFAEFFGSAAPGPGQDEPSLLEAYRRDLAEARSLGLFQLGGIRGKDHLLFWCLGRALQPQLYIESGVFIGSSLHAFLCNPTLVQAIGIDPNLSTLRVPRDRHPGLRLVDDQDFSQLKLPPLPDRSFAYFDDHINTAARILQAADKGLACLAFDDSTGMHGLCQRLYPAAPTLGMIMHCDQLRVGDELSWTFPQPRRPTRLAALRQALFNTPPPFRGSRVTMRITAELIEQCAAARRCVRRWRRLPDLGFHLPPARYEIMPDADKYLVELAVS